MRRKQIGLKASNVLLSTGVVAIFMYLLVLAMAQDQVMAKLSRLSDFANYSASLIDARKAKDADKQIDERVEERQKLRAQVIAAENRAALAKLLYEREAGRLRPAIAILQSTPECRIARNPIDAVGGLTEQETEIRVTQADLAAAQECFKLNDKLGGDRHRLLEQTLASAKSRLDAMVQAEMASKAMQQRGAVLQAEINRLVKDRNLLAPSRVHFTVLDPLEPPDWFPTNFVNYPPFIVRVLLSFFSGTFGALLITMVFLVYPSKLRERVSAKLYYKRVFLGGLVALTVFIVLTGGASILGTSEVATDDANVMSFTAIGLLAGMFSDTVADWLSARAKTMFSGDEDEDGRDGGDPKEAARDRTVAPEQ
jgi:hypothetical protein